MVLGPIRVATKIFSATRTAWQKQKIVKITKFMQSYYNFLI